MINFDIIEVDQSHILWNDLFDLALTIDKRNRNWLVDCPDHFISSHNLVAIENKNLLGFLRFSVQRLGKRERKPLIVIDNQILIEAYVETFGVSVKYRRQGIGRALQNEAMKRAKEKGCFQLRSESYYKAVENYRLKVSMGFSICPNFKTESVYFIRVL